MPLYEYQCDACGKRFEQIQKFSDGPPEACANCGKGPVRRLLSSPAIQFKGAGWYITDYARKGGSGAGSTPDAAKAEKSGGSEASGASDTKAATSEPSASPASPSSTTGPAPAKPAN